jgi:predicted amidohydrolase
MHDLNLTFIQTNQFWEDKLANLSMFESYFNQIRGTHLVVLPEMFHTGFSMSTEKLAEDWSQSEGINFLKIWASKLNSAIYTSMIIKEEGKIYNRGVFIYPNGELVKYDKRKSFGLGGEDKFYTAGNQEVIVDWKGWKINLQICYDLRFPELVRNHMEADSAAYDIILYVANWPQKRILHWDTLLKARAIENQCYVAGVNRVGIDGNALEYSGGSAVYNALGEKICFAEDFQNQVKCITLNSMNLKETRANLPFLKDR